MANHWKIRNIFRIFDNIYTTRQIRQAPERRAKTVRYGVMSIIYAILAVPCSLTLFILPWMFGGEGILLLLFGIGAVAAGVSGVLIFTVRLDIANLPKQTSRHLGGTGILDRLFGCLRDHRLLCAERPVTRI